MEKLKRTPENYEEVAKSIPNDVSFVFKTNDRYWGECNVYYHKKDDIYFIEISKTCQIFKQYYDPEYLKIPRKLTTIVGELTEFCGAIFRELKPKLCPACVEKMELSHVIHCPKKDGHVIWFGTKACELPDDHHLFAPKPYDDDPFVTGGNVNRVGR